MNQSESSNDELHLLIRESIDEWKDTQLNISSESARDLLAKSIHKRVHGHIKQLIEDIVCPQSTWE